MEPRINVLLATYNGARFLREQLDSFDAQTLRPARVTIRDDGSTDETVRIVTDWAAGRSGVTLLRGSNLGVTKNFFALLAYPDQESEYFAFSDQDDVWLPTKIERALASLREYPKEVPALYCSRQEYVDQNLNRLGYSRIPKGTGFANALVQNLATGCTMLLNRSARDLVGKRVPENAMIHDWWCYLVVSAFGRVIYDPIPTIKYRQHENNLTGGPYSWFRLLRGRAIRYVNLRGRKLLSDQAIEFRRCFGDRLSAENKQTLDRFLAVRGELGARLRYTAAMDVWRQSWVETNILRAMILMGRV